MLYSYVWSSIIVDRNFFEGSGFLACGQYRPGVKIGLETHQRINREVETGDAHIPSSMQRVYHHFGGRAVAIEIAGGWVCTHRFSSSELQFNPYGFPFSSDELQLAFRLPFSIYVLQLAFWLPFSTYVLQLAFGLQTMMHSTP
ncbi:hypothetical protein J1N35_030286 [Gossypium stocksii]|uniref:Uncharacterized protein n=1 Tax=Gossypium stocksii TaxID=47602 RepID=A0A9D3V1L8_9ROSI|nr:hypothetical protein J1N35_030286 [Gossypium stocksii]